MKKQVFLICFIFLHFSLSAQTSSEKIKQHINTLDSFYQLSPLEKAYLHTDKNWYTPGETIWFKGYITVDNQLTELSKVIYVDLLNAKDSVVLKSMWKLNNNGCKGDITIPSNTVDGKYKMRVYTMWMLNTPEVIDEKIISIFSPTPAIIAPSKITNNSSKYRVNFFPEGGHLINGLKSILSYKITNAEGVPVDDAVVTIENELGNELIKSIPYHFGMGSFEFIPNNQTKYKVAAKIDGVRYIPDFPFIEEKGITLSVNPLNNSRIFYSINRQETEDKIIPEIFIIAQINGIVIYSEKIKLEELVTGGAISKKNIPHGVLTITVFNNNMFPLAERVVYIKKEQFISPQIVIERSNLLAKSKNSFRVILPSDSANLSVSVFSADQSVPNIQNNSIASYFLLNSEIKGSVYNPNYYLESTDSAHNAALDLLMQTQGWRRISWQSVFDKKLPLLNYFIETGISVRGLATTNGVANAAVKEAKINMIIKGDDSTTIIAETNILKGGKFSLNDLDFRKSAKLYYQGTKINTRNQDLSITVLPNYFDTLAFYKKSKLTLSQLDTSNSLSKKILIIQFYDNRLATNDLTLANVTVKSRVKTIEQKLTDEYVSDWYKSSDFTFAIDSLMNYPSIWQFLQGMVPGLNVSGDLFNPKVNFTRYEGGGVSDASVYSESIYESLNTVGGEVKSRIAFFINEMPVSIENINSISPRDIALIKVNRLPNLVGNAIAGSMFIYTRKGYSSNGAKSMEIQTITGYTISKEYFSPVYETEESKIQIDKRSSLYWNPTLKINNKQAIINFYNSDKVKKYKIVVEGLDKNGIPIWAEKIIE